MHYILLIYPPFLPLNMLKFLRRMAKNTCGQVDIIRSSNAEGRDFIMIISPYTAKPFFKEFKMKKKITIHINQKPFHFEKDELSPQDFRDAVGAPSEYEVWLIQKSPDPEGQLPVDDIQITSPVEIKDGQRYRVVPPGTFG
jgi:hypothetical protein